MIRRHFRNLNHRNIYPLYTDSVIVQNPGSLAIQPGYSLEYIDEISTRTSSSVILQDWFLYLRIMTILSSTIIRALLLILQNYKIILA